MPPVDVVPDGVPPPTVMSGLIQFFLQGIIVVQASRFFDSWSEESLRLQILTVSIVVFSILQTALEGYKVWRVSIELQDWGSSRFVWADLLLSGVLCALCQSYLIRRCWKVLNRNLFCAMGMSLLALGNLTACIYEAVSISLSYQEAFQKSGQLHLKVSTFVAFNIWAYGSLLLDIILTGILTAYLRQSRTGHPSSDRIIRRITVIAWETALLPALAQLIAVALYHNHLSTRNPLCRLFIILSGKFYAIGYLRTLNSRSELRERIKSHDLGRTSLSSWEWNQENTVVRTPLSPPRDPGSPCAQITSRSRHLTDNCINRSPKATMNRTSSPTMQASFTGAGFSFQ